MAEPTKMHKGNEAFTATSPTQVLQMLKEGWMRGELPEPTPEPKKRGRPSKKTVETKTVDDAK